MLGAIIGDIVGSRFEFNNHKSTDFELFSADCHFTDDTICTLAVADALLNNLSFKQSLHSWCRKYIDGGYGRNFMLWVKSDNPKPYNSFGNGAAMRVSPCAWFSQNKDEILAAARQSAICSHNHPEGVRGAMCIAHCIYLARFNPPKRAIYDLATKDYGYNLDVNCDDIRRTNKFNETCQVTVPQAITCFLESSNFEDAIRLAISIGGDSDTIAAITGSIAESYYAEIPSAITQKALSYLPNEMVDLIKDFYYYYLSEKNPFKEK